MSKEGLTRRDVLKMLTFSGLGALTAIYGPNIIESLKLGSIEADTGPSIPTPTSTATSTATVVPKPTETSTPKPTEVIQGPVIERDGVRITGVPEKIDSSTIDVARGQFINSLGFGTEGFIAEPGGLLVGPDFGSKSAKNPFGENPKGWDAMYDSGGSIRPFSSVSQEVLRWRGPAFQNLPEGGFVFTSWGEGVAKIAGATFTFREELGRNYFFIVRGLYPDGKQDSDLNKTIEFDQYKPGHAEVEMYESRFQTNTAFISEGQFLQKVQTSHSAGTNCGAEGCSRLKVVMFDINTKALSILEQVQGRFGDPKVGWQSIFRNW